jgi:hypothetical protein
MVRQKVADMETIIKNFMRISKGVWVCVSPTELKTPSGSMQVAQGTRLTRGTMCGDIDVAKLLDEEYEKQNKK